MSMASSITCFKCPDCESWHPDVIAVRQHMTRRHQRPLVQVQEELQSCLCAQTGPRRSYMPMTELLVDLKITPQHLGSVVRENNRTRKRTRHEHFPKLRYKKPIYKQSELDNFYNEVSKYPLDKIISLDETSIGSYLKPTYSRCYLGKRCVITTDNNFVFRSFTLLVAINNKKCVGKELYEKGGTTKERMV
jgi:hypothetical protein